MFDDRDVLPKGDELAGKRVEFIVTGGIGGIESPKLIRELRRYGAELRVWMTKSATEFVQPRVFEWASKKPVITDLSGSAEHISDADFAVISPCTLDFMAKLSLGIADSPSLTCLQSLLNRKPVFIQPSMHSSLAESPSFQASAERLRSIQHLHWIAPMKEESKWKMPSFEDTTAQICHSMNLRSDRFLVLLGATQSKMDDVRFVGNYSSGALGMEIAKLLYRKGFQVQVLAGSTSVSHPSYLSIERQVGSKEFKDRALELSSEKNFQGIVSAVALLDFDVQNSARNKISSEEKLQLQLLPASKLLDQLRAKTDFLVGFKLEAGLSESALQERVKTWNKTKHCDLVIANRREDISETNYRSWVYQASSSSSEWVSGREGTAKRIPLAFLEASRKFSLKKGSSYEHPKTLDVANP